MYSVNKWKRKLKSAVFQIVDENLYEKLQYCGKNISHSVLQERKKGRVLSQKKNCFKGEKRRKKSLAHLKEKKKIDLERKSKLLLLKSEDEKES